MIRIAVVEDDSADRKKVENYLRQYEKKQKEEFSVTSFHNGQDIAYHYTADFDIIFMDIEMGAVSGMEAAQLIRTMDRDVIIIFLTNAPQYAIQGYAVEAMDYVLKPVSYFAFADRLGRAIERLGRFQTEYISANLGRRGVKKLDIQEIYYVEVQEHTLIYHMKYGNLTVFGVMRDVEEKLQQKGFFRCNKGFLVNLRYVESYRDGCAMVGGDSVPVSRAKKKPFLDALNNYLSENGK